MNIAGKQFIKFCVVGVIATAVNYAAFFILYQLGINYLIASGAGFIFGVAVGYPLNMKWSFADLSSTKSSSISIYVSVYIFSLFLSIALLYSLVNFLHIIPTIANIICIFITTITNFVGVKYLSFYDSTKKTDIFINVKQIILKLSRSPLFYIGLIIKIILIFVFSDDYFLSKVSHSYDSAYTVPVVYIFTIINQFSSLYIYKLFLLLCDFVILLILLSWLKGYFKRVLKVYWFSPLIAYIVYYLGYIDILAIMLIFLSTFLLFKRKTWLSFMILGIALSIKIPVILIIPFFMIYAFFVGIPIKKIILFPIVIVVVFIILNIQSITDPSFLTSVLLDNSKSLVLIPNFKYDDSLYVYIVPALYILLILYAYYLQIRSKDMLIIFVGFVFATILIFINSNPSWYIWFVPFLIYFYLQIDYRNIKFLILLQVVFLVYFILFPYNNSPVLLESFPFNIDKTRNILFTLLQTLMLINIFLVYRNGIAKIANKKLVSKKIYLGIGGDSGSGKTTFSNLISSLFDANNTFVIHGDDTHKWERGNSNWQNFTHLNPKANNLNKEFSFLLSLNDTKNFLRKVYDHDTGKFVKRKINNVFSRLVIYEGLHPFYLKRIRDFFDAKIFIYPDSSLQIHWKIIRDAKKRGYTKEQVIKQLTDRQNDSDKYIKSQAKFADIIVSFKPVIPIFNIGDENEEVEYYLSLQIVNSVQIDDFIDEISSIDSLKIESLYNEDHYIINIKGNISKEQVEALANRLPLSMVGINNPVWEDGYNGILQLIILYYILEICNVY
ncbi:MAG: GtrA family protein [Alphaproteobacteria bacterium]|jgi:uridine kinase/putative flippase GtrA|nr:GtrA family protein [Alphaproteobacteria bacterium]